MVFRERKTKSTNIYEIKAELRRPRAGSLLGYAHGDCCFKLAGQICRGWHGHRELREHGCFSWSSVSLPLSLSCKPRNLSSVRGVTLSALQPQQWKGLSGNSSGLPPVQARQFVTQKIKHDLGTGQTPSLPLSATGWNQSVSMSKEPGVFVTSVIKCSSLTIQGRSSFCLDMKLCEGSQFTVPVRRGRGVDFFRQEGEHLPQLLIPKAAQRRK